MFKDIVQHYLQQIRFEEDKYARMIGLPQFGGANDELLTPPRRRS